MRRRRYQFRVRYIQDNEVKHCIITTTNVEQVHLHMKCDYPDSDIHAIYELKQVWGKG